jgi:hypothetical protein
LDEGVVGHARLCNANKGDEHLRMRLQLFVVDDCGGHEKQPQNGNYEKHRKDRKKDLRVRVRILESCSVGRLVSVAKIVCL